MKALVLFPHQLFQTLPVGVDCPIYLVEEQLFFQDPHYEAHYHIQRLIFHRASMRAYAVQLQQAGYAVFYLPYARDLEMNYLFQPLQDNQVECLQLIDPCDFMLEKRLYRYAARLNMEIEIFPSPAFLCTRDYLQDYFDAQSYSHQRFYIHERKARNILVNEQGKALGGKWSFDADNRKKLPQSQHPPDLPALSETDRHWVERVQKSVETEFPDAWGSSQNFIYPVSHAGAQAWLEHFLHHRLALFGDYEDAITPRHDSLYHSLLSPLLNSGLLTPQQVLDAALRFAEEHTLPLNALEGFVRQILGWREYVRALYLREGVKQRNGNYWEHLHPMPRAFYTAQTGLEPVDHVIRKLQRLAYAHHIERLMILGNIMCLCEIHPNAVYTWFMECFIDAYDWVMVPNVYGMSQYADGGLMTTKPYISSSNYIRKMSDFPTGPWCDIWDALYWRFVHKHRAFFEANPRLSVMTHHLDRMGDKLNRHIEVGENFLAELHSSKQKY